MANKSTPSSTNSESFSKASNELSSESLAHFHRRDNRGSGSDLNSDTSRLSDPSELHDKADEDSFPASDPISSVSPMTSLGRKKSSLSSNELPADFKNNPEAQFQYGRESERKTLHFDPSSHRLDIGNPDIGDVDLGTIEADQPPQRDDDIERDVLGSDPRDAEM